MTTNAFTYRLAGIAAVLLIAVLVWRVGTRVIFDDRDGSSESRAANAGAAANPFPAGELAGANQPAAAAARTGPLVAQEPSGRLQLTPQNVAFRSNGLRAETIDGEPTLSGWRNESDSAEWDVQLTQVGDGYLRARVRYRSLQAIRLQLSAGEKRLALWNLAEARPGNVEEKLIRLKQAGEYRLRITPLGDATSLQILELSLQTR